MKKSLLTFAGVLLVALSAATLGKADPITGEIDINQFGSTATVDFATKTVTFNPTTTNATVGHATGDYAGLLGTSATYLSFSYASGAPAQMLWSIDGSTYFMLETFTYVAETGTVGLSLWGTGTEYLAGHDATQGMWTFSSSTPDITNPSIQFNFSSSNSTTLDRNVPDGGTTAMLVGFGLVGMGFIARRRK